MGVWGGGKLLASGPASIPGDTCVPNKCVIHVIFGVEGPQRCKILRRAKPISRNRRSRETTAAHAKKPAFTMISRMFHAVFTAFHGHSASQSVIPSLTEFFQNEANHANLIVNHAILLHPASHNKPKFAALLAFQTATNENSHSTLKTNHKGLDSIHRPSQIL